MILVLQDVTQLRQQDEIKRGVIRTVSHQLKTPLTSIRMAIHLLLEEKVGALTEKQAELLRRGPGGQRPAARDPQQPSRHQPHRIGQGPDGIPGRLAAHRWSLDAVEPFRRTAQDHGVGLHVGRRRATCPTSGSDTTRIGHVFGNLLSNALKHTPPGGRITLTAEADEAWVRFTVSDTGEGIPAEFLPQRLRAILPGPRPRRRDRARGSGWPSSRRSSRPTAGRSAWRAAKAQGIDASPSPCGGPTGSRKERPRRTLIDGRPRLGFDRSGILL